MLLAATPLLFGFADDEVTTHKRLGTGTRTRSLYKQRSTRVLVPVVLRYALCTGATGHVLVRYRYS
eukprot:scaffold244087_cov28-Prasinocladus_malaysianus.AAC.3